MKIGFQTRLRKNIPMSHLLAREEPQSSTVFLHRVVSRLPCNHLRKDKLLNIDKNKLSMKLSTKLSKSPKVTNIIFNKKIASFSMPEFWIISILMLLLPLLWVGLNKRVLGLVDFFSFLHEKNRVGWIFFFIYYYMKNSDWDGFFS